MDWKKQSKKGHISGNTEWHTDIGTERVKTFNNRKQATYRMNKLNSNLPSTAPQWEIYDTFGKPKLKRVLT